MQRKVDLFTTRPLAMARRAAVAGQPTGKEPHHTHTGYTGKPGIAERRLGVALSVLSSCGLLTALFAIQGHDGPRATTATRLTTFAIASADNPGAPASQPAPPSPSKTSAVTAGPSVARLPAPAIPMATALLPAPVPARSVPVPSRLATPDLPLMSFADHVPVSSQGADPAHGRLVNPAIDPATEVAPGPTGTSAPATADAYAQEVFRKIRRAQRYEAVLQRDNLEGTVVLAFTIDRLGSLRAERVATPSAHPTIDQLALRHLSIAAPFPRPPRGAARSFQIPLTYRQSD